MTYVLQRGNFCQRINRDGAILGQERMETTMVGSVLDCGILAKQYNLNFSV
jgi:hypothetical protein